MFGTIIGISAATYAAPKTGGNDATYDQLVLFADVLSRVQYGYVEETDPADLVTDALNGVLQALDPHSHYSRAPRLQKATKALSPRIWRAWY